MHVRHPSGARDAALGSQNRHVAVRRVSVLSISVLLCAEWLCASHFLNGTQSPAPVVERSDYPLAKRLVSHNKGSKKGLDSELAAC